jgi:3-oxoacyl-[acyl-carrier-protein] synthase-1
VTSSGVNQHEVCVVGLGAATAVGSTAPSTAAAVRAGIATFSDHPFMIDKRGEPFVVANAPYMAIELGIEERIAELALRAATESMVPLAALQRRIEDIAAYIGIPSERPGLPPSLVSNLSARLGKLREDKWRLSEIRCLPNGHSAGLMAIEAACARIHSGACEFCLAGGVDSYLDPDTLKWIEACDQLHASDNAWGFIPGEAASFCLLSTAEAAQRYGLATHGKIIAVATAYEENRIKTETVCIGRGLTAAVRKVLEALPPEGPVIDNTICDQNGEAYRADEYGFTLARTNKRFVDASSFLTPADCCGDVGAASGPLFVGLAAAASKKRYAKGPCTLVWTSSEGGERSAAIIRTAASSTKVS